MKEIVKAFDGRQVRAVLIHGEPWFVLADVCEVLGISNSRDTATRLDDDEKGVGKIYTLGGKQEMTTINESGLYAVIMRSDKPQARSFRKWVTSEVLPSIRKTGRYDIPADRRKKAAEVRHAFTDTLRNHGCDAPIHYIKITATMKAGAGINGHKPKADMDKIELAKVEAAEMLAAINLMQEDADGYDECKPICQNAAHHVAIATAQRQAIA